MNDWARLAVPEGKAEFMLLNLKEETFRRGAWGREASRHKWTVWTSLT